LYLVKADRVLDSDEIVLRMPRECAAILANLLTLVRGGSVAEVVLACAIVNGMEMAGLITNGIDKRWK
jgi:hypothetical protein